MTKRFAVAGLLTALVVVGSSFIVACGGGGDGASGNDSSGADEEFVASMIPHHQSAIEMAELARDQAEHREIRDLADEIIETQASEIAQMRELSRRTGTSSEHSGMHGEDGGMGLSDEEMGMGGMTESLDGAIPFDRAFIDAMIPHHRGAIRMARAALARGSDPEVEALARAIIAAQNREIAQMNAWRLEWYGARSPASGMHEMHSGGGSSDGGMDHMDH